MECSSDWYDTGVITKLIFKIELLKCQSRKNNFTNQSAVSQLQQGNLAVYVCGASHGELGFRTP